MLLDARHKKKLLGTAIVSAMIAIGFTSTASSSEGLVLEEVIVSAQKRQESLQDVPIAISAFDGDFLERSNIVDIADLSAMTPGFSSAAADPATPQIYMRGIGTNDFGVASDPSVGLFIDGVYSGRFGSAISSLDNIQSIEVLKGPQGTLFGRNTIGGAISITTKQPSNELEAKVSVGVGNYGHDALKASLSMPLVEDSLYVAASVNQVRNDGWQENLASGDRDGAGKDEVSGRLNVTWYPSDDLEIVLRNDWSRADQNFGYQKALAILGQTSPAAATQVLQGLAALAGYQPQTIAALAIDPINFDLDDPDSRVAGTVSEFDRRVRGHSLTVKLDINDNYSFTSISAYREHTLDSQTPSANLIDYFSVPDSLEAVETYSQEFRLNGQFESIDWFAGVSAFREDATSFKHVRARILGPSAAGAIAAGYGVPFDVFYGFDESSQSHNRTESIAVYGDATWHLSDQWSLLFGLRYTRDEKEFSLDNPGFAGVSLDRNPDLAASGILTYTNLGILFPANLSGPGTALSDRRDDSWSNLSGRLVASYDISDETQIYVSAAQGYKSGGFNTFPGINLTTLQVSNDGFDPELVVSYELGLKSSLLDSRMRINAALYQYTYEDLQVLTSDPNSNSGIILNAGEATGRGLEVDMTFQATENLRLSTALSWIDAEYDDFRISDSLNLKGQELNRAPRFSGSIAADYVINTGFDGLLSLNASYSYTGEQRYSATLEHQPIPGLSADLAREEGYGLLSARLTYLSSDESWNIALWGTNLSDQEYLAERGSGAQGLGLMLGRAGAPRMFGIEVGYNF